ncbi:MAG: type II CAAX endopeptidase family protein [Cyanobacteria bacterium J06642_9]
MTKHFLGVADEGDDQGWHYLLGILAVLVYWLGFAGLIFLGLEAIFAQIFGPTEIGDFIASSATFLPVIVILFGVVTKLQHRSFQTLINADAAVNVPRVLLGFMVWFIQLVIFSGSDIWLNPQNYSFSFNLVHWFLLGPLAAILIPIQTSAEEFFFRGYLMQGLAMLTKHRLVLTLLTSIAFAVPHFGNPEMQGGVVWGALTYFVWGVFFATITLKDNGLELALGCHAANNLFATLVVNTPDSVIPTTALWTYLEAIDSRAGFVGLIIEATIFYCIFFGGIQRRGNPLE